jgi:hypothetical protein
MSDRLRYLKRIINQQGNRDVICLRNDDAHYILDEVERLRVENARLNQIAKYNDVLVIDGEAKHVKRMIGGK